MSFNKYFQEELLYLREMGEEFARAYPKLAPFLARKGNDPDVERVLEGFAFIAGRIRQKLDDELPELTHTLLSLLWPHYLRPIPSMSILQFTPVASAVTEKKIVAKGIEVDSVAVDNTPCRFRTSSSVDLYPLSLDDLEVQTTGASSVLKLTFQLNGGVGIENIHLDKLRLFLHGELNICSSLYLWFFRHLDRITIQPAGARKGDQKIHLPPTSVLPVGLTEEEELIPYHPNSFGGYRLLQEYFSLPQKFLFVDLEGLQPVAHLPINDKFEVIFEFAKPLEGHVRLTKNNIRLFCTPIINIFEKDASPIRLNHEKVEYRVYASGANSTHYEIFSIDKVTGWVHGTGDRKVYKPFISFDHRVDASDTQATFYRTRVYPSVIGRGVDTYLSFVTAADEKVIPSSETISIDLTCTNRSLPEKLRIGDVKTATNSSPEYVEFQNILPMTRSIPPPLEGSLHWQLISNMSLNYVSLANVDAIRLILSTYNFPAYYDKQAARVNELRMEGIESINMETITLMFKGLPARGVRTNLAMRSSKFSGEGDMYLFAVILNEFLSLYASVNSFNQLVAKDIDRGEIYKWKPRIGQQPLI